MSWLTAVGVVLLVIWFVREYMLVFVNANTALILINCFGKIKKFGPGLNFKQPWFFEKPVDNPKDGIVHLVAIPETFDGVFETKDKSTIKLSIAYIRTPVLEYLEQYIKIDDDRRLEGITERIRAITNIVIHGYDDRSKVMNELAKISKEINDQFDNKNSEKTSTDDSLKLEEYFGENIQQIMVTDAELPPEIIAAQTKSEAQVMENKTKLAAQVAENETRKLEMDNIRKMTEEAVADSKRLKSPMSSKEAMDAVLIVQGKTKKDIKVFDLGPGAQTVMAGLGKGLAQLGKGVFTAVEKLAKEGDKNGQ